ncbi:MAG: hypothetical protein AVDCRST_MAG19-2319, partial [uncultured Thermomicrobiales bacterium]
VCRPFSPSPIGARSGVVGGTIGRSSFCVFSTPSGRLEGV